MKTKTYLDGLLILPEIKKIKNKDYEFIKILQKYNLIEQNNEFYYIPFQKLQFLYDENEDFILNKLNIIYPFNFNEFTIEINEFNIIDITKSLFFYNSNQLSLYEKYFFITNEKIPKFIIIDDILLNIINLISDINLKDKTKISKLYKLSNIYGFKI